MSRKDESVQNKDRICLRPEVMMAFTDPVSDLQTTALQHCMKISYSEFHPNRLVSVEYRDRNVFTALQKV